MFNIYHVCLSNASSLLVFLHANISLLLRWQRFYFDMQMSWLEEDLLGGSKAALQSGKNLKNVSRFSDAAEKCYQGIQRHVLKMSTNDLCPCSIVSCPAEWRRQRRRGVFWDSSGLISFTWHWAAQAVFIIDSTGAAGIKALLCCGCYYSWSLLLFAPIAPKKTIKHFHTIISQTRSDLLIFIWPASPETKKNLNAPTTALLF